MSSICRVVLDGTRDENGLKKSHLDLFYFSTFVPSIFPYLWISFPYEREVFRPFPQDPIFIWN